MKKFFLKSLIFIFLIFIIQLWMIPIPIDIYKKSMQLKNYFHVYGASDILYFGDSTTFLPAPNDKIPVSMQGILEKLINKRVLTIANAAFDMDIYYVICKYMINNGYRPKIVIVPINLRSFGPEWDSDPSWQFTRDRKIWSWDDSWKLRFLKPLTVFKYAQPPITKMEFENLKVFDGNQCVGRVRDFIFPSQHEIDNEMRKKMVILQYFFPLPEDHPKIKILQKLAGLFKEHGIKGIFYITPVNYQTGEQLGGARFKEKISEKVRVIKTTMAEIDVEVLDLTFVYPAEFFGRSPNQALTEHLTFPGRAGVVTSILKAMKDAQHPGLPHSYRLSHSN